MRTGNLAPNTMVVVDPKALMARMVDLFVDRAEETIERKSTFCAALSRRVPGRFFERLDSASPSHPLAWDRIHLFWVDQCCGTPDGETDCSAAAQRFAHYGNMPAANVHEICRECQSCESAASAYEQTISQVAGRGRPGVPSFDLMLLRLSPDGRITSLFPDTYAFYESQRLVWVNRFIGTGLTYITLTHPLLHAARHIVISVSGLENAVTLRDVFTAEPDPIRYPAHALWPVLDRITWLVDKDTAKLLPRSLSPTVARSA